MIRPCRGVVDLGARIVAGNDEFTGRIRRGIREIIQVALERDSGRTHCARRQPHRQPFARIRIHLKRQITMDGRHRAAHHRAAHVDATRRGLALRLPLALQAHVQVIVHNMRLRNVYKPMIRVRPLDLRIQGQFTRGQGWFLEHARQRYTQVLHRPLDRQVGSARAARQRHPSYLNKVTRQTLHAKLRRRTLHRRAVLGRRPVHASHGNISRQHGELAAIQLQPRPAGHPSRNHRRLDPRRPGLGLDIVQFRIELAAPVCGVGGIGGEQAAVEFPAQFHIASQRLAGRGPQHKAVRQAAVAHQKINTGQRQRGGTAQVVLPDDRCVFNQQFALPHQPSQGRVIKIGLMVAGIQVDILPRHPQVVRGIAPQGQLGLFDPQTHQPWR
ncbi:hypothetical protein D3C71_1217990 [compost metagenome]